MQDSGYTVFGLTSRADSTQDICQNKSISRMSKGSLIKCLEQFYRR